jgi:hypothetical protein
MPIKKPNAQCRTPRPRKSQMLSAAPPGLGCRFMLDHFFSQEGLESSVIVLEDDLLLSKDALTFFKVSPSETPAQSFFGVILKKQPGPRAVQYTSVAEILNTTPTSQAPYLKSQLRNSKPSQTQALTTRKSPQNNQDGASLMARDDSVMCVSGYNDNGFEALSTDSGR